MKTSFLRAEMTVDSKQSVSCVPVGLGVRAIGSLGISGARLSRQTLEAIGSLVAIGIELARAVEQLWQTEAERQGERLKSALLDSVPHDFRTPLTSMKAAVTSLLSSPNPDSAQSRELLTIIDEECDRLNHLVEEAGEMAKLEAGEVTLDLAPTPVNEIIGVALSHCKSALAGRRVEVRIA